ARQRLGVVFRLVCRGLLWQKPPEESLRAGWWLAPGGPGRLLSGDAVVADGTLLDRQGVRPGQTPSPRPRRSRKGAGKRPQPACGEKMPGRGQQPISFSD